MVLPGTLKWDAKSLDLRFTLSDGQASVPVRHRGTPPDLFAEGRGAVVEGTWSHDGYFQATTILAKHSEEYKAPHDENQAGYKELLKTSERPGGKAMTPELGYAATVAALILAVYGSGAAAAERGEGGARTCASPRSARRSASGCWS